MNLNKTKSTIFILFLLIIIFFSFNNIKVFALTISPVRLEIKGNPGQELIEEMTLVNETNNILAAALILIKKIDLFNKYGYAPKGFLIDYHNQELVKAFTNALKKYYYPKNVAFIKINPEIVDKNDVEGLEDLILTAVNNAVQEVKKFADEKSKSVTGNIKLPEGFNF